MKAKVVVYRSEENGPYTCTIPGLTGIVVQVDNLEDAPDLLGQAIGVMANIEDNEKEDSGYLCTKEMEIVF